MPRLTATPAEIETHLATLGHRPQRLAAWAGPRAWSAVEVLAHLRACADLRAYSIYAMLAENEPALALLDERRWDKAASYALLLFHSPLQTFTLARAELLAVLRPQPGSAPPTSLAANIPSLARRGAWRCTSRSTGRKLKRWSVPAKAFCLTIPSRRFSRRVRWPMMVDQKFGIRRGKKYTTPAETITMTCE